LDLLAGTRHSPRLRPVIRKFGNRVREGKSLSEAVTEAGVFSKSIHRFLPVKGGNLSASWNYYITYHAVAPACARKFSLGLYPVLLVTVACIVVILPRDVVSEIRIAYEDMKSPAAHTHHASSSRSLSIIVRRPGSNRTCSWPQ